MATSNEFIAIDGLMAFGGLADAYMRTCDLVSEVKLVGTGISLSVKHAKAAPGFMSWEILAWEDLLAAENLEDFVIEVFRKHAGNVLEKANLPLPMIRPYRVR